MCLSLYCYSGIFMYYYVLFYIFIFLTFNSIRHQFSVLVWVDGNLLRRSYFLQGVPRRNQYKFVLNEQLGYSQGYRVNSLGIVALLWLCVQLVC